MSNYQFKLIRTLHPILFEHKINLSQITLIYGWCFLLPVYFTQPKYFLRNYFDLNVFSVAVYIENSWGGGASKAIGVLI